MRLLYALAFLWIGGWAVAFGVPQDSSPLWIAWLQALPFLGLRGVAPLEGEVAERAIEYLSLLPGIVLIVAAFRMQKGGASND